MKTQNGLNGDTANCGWRLESTYAELPDAFSASWNPVPVRSPKLVLLNRSLSKYLGLAFEGECEDKTTAIFSGNQLPAGAVPIAQAYAGHQYGGFTMLGDGRAILLGEQRTPSGQLFDIQLKGSGQTPFSRRGDGRAAIGPMLREYIISEAMFALGIPTTRSLAVVTTGEPVYRETLLPGAVLTRIAASHIRVGTFEYFSAREDEDGLRILADYTIARHYPEIDNEPDRYLRFLNAVIDGQASLIARWQQIGFVHGVMNTDNVAISGETIDYGPCAFMDTYDPNTVFSSIDSNGRYAYGNQPKIGQWNLARFAESLLPLLDSDQTKAIAIATEAIHAFPEIYQQYWLSGMRRKLGLRTEQQSDNELIESLLSWMHRNQADFTNTFRDLSTEAVSADKKYQDGLFQKWYSLWKDRLNRENVLKSEVLAQMQSTNPAAIPRNHLVEEALASATEHADYSLTEKLLRVISSPFDISTEDPRYQAAPSPTEHVYRTFCGT
jgi:serine/tyrosine/threonine adenylyltransferase